MAARQSHHGSLRVVEGGAGAVEAVGADGVLDHVELLQLWGHRGHGHSLGGAQGTGTRLGDTTTDRQTNSSFLAQKGARGPELPGTVPAQLGTGSTDQTGDGENQTKGRVQRKTKGIYSDALRCLPIRIPSRTQPRFQYFVI